MSRMKIHAHIVKTSQKQENRIEISKKLRKNINKTRAKRYKNEENLT